jgi:hypothetical protein
MVSAGPERADLYVLRGSKNVGSLPKRPVAAPVTMAERVAAPVTMTERSRCMVHDYQQTRGCRLPLAGIIMINATTGRLCSMARKTIRKPDCKRMRGADLQIGESTHVQTGPDDQVVRAPADRG